MQATTFQKIIVPTELTFLSKCALGLGMEIARLAEAGVEVLSVIETKENSFMETTEAYHNDPTSSIRNIQLTEESRQRMHERVEEIAEWAPGLPVTPKILYGERTQTLVEEVKSQEVDMVIMGGDYYDPADRTAQKFLNSVTAPVLILKCMIQGLDHFKDIILLADLERDTDELIRHLKKLQSLLDAKIHVLRINTPRNFLSFKKCTASLEEYATKHQLENVELISKDAKTEQEGLLDYCDSIQFAFVATAIHERGFIRSLMSNKNQEGEMIANSVHPMWTYKN